MISPELALQLNKIGYKADNKPGNQVYRKFRDGYRVHTLSRVERLSENDLPCPNLEELVRKVTESGYLLQCTFGAQTKTVVLLQDSKCPGLYQMLGKFVNEDESEAVCQALIRIHESKAWEHTG